MKRSLERKVHKAIAAANAILREETGEGREPRLVITAAAVQAVDDAGRKRGSPVTVVTDAALS